MKQLIELSELRIGNILLYKGKYVHVTMLSMDIDDEYTDVIGFCELGKSSNEHSDWNRTLYNDLNRIGITEDVLKMVGFNAVDFDNDMCEGMYQNSEVETIVLTGNVYSFHFPSLWAGDIEIKYLHQLQNLYFALYSKDLKALNINS